MATKTTSAFVFGPFKERFSHQRGEKVCSVGTRSDRLFTPKVQYRTVKAAIKETIRSYSSSAAPNGGLQADLPSAGRLKRSTIGTWGDSRGHGRTSNSGNCAICISSGRCRSFCFLDTHTNCAFSRLQSSHVTRWRHHYHFKTGSTVRRQFTCPCNEVP